MRILFALFLMLVSLPALAAPVVGEPAPDFTGTDTAGKSRSLSEFAGKTVVLEWTNHQCPYVRKHYKSRNMQETQKHADDLGVVWLRIISSAPGKQGHVSAMDANKVITDNGVVATATILDESGEIGHLYDAKTTPHMFVIGPDGVLVYQGAIDNKPTSDPDDIDTAKNYVKTVLDDMKAGRAVSVDSTQAYGCAIKYE